MGTSAPICLRAIVLALHNRPATAEALAAKFGVTRRTIRRDIKCLRALGLPISGRRGLAESFVDRASDAARQHLSGPVLAFGDNGGFCL